MPTMRSTGNETPSIQSLDRGLAILEAVARSGDPVPLGQLTGVLGIDRSSVFRLANTLKRRGFLANPIGRKDYILGPSIWRLSRRYDWSNVLIAAADPHLKTLALRTRETAHLAVREGARALFIDHSPGANQVIVVSGQTGETVPLHCTAHGKALLAGCGPAELRAILGDAPLERHTARTIVSLADLAAACARIQADGLAIDDREYVEEARCLAAPIRDRDGVVIASIGISAPLARIPEERYPVFARHVHEAARAVTLALAGTARD
jgi:DNA-binding IclR family transcriptional regulator